MEGIITNVVIFIFIWTILPFVDDVQSTIICGQEICHGSGAYCCDTGGCCWKTYIYEFWWFWVIWVVVFFLILACSANYWRRQWRGRQMVAMTNSQYPNYGTVIRSHLVNRGLTNPANQQGPYAAPPPNYTQAQLFPQHPQSTGYTASSPPSYLDSEATKNEKPPAYSA